tara:strand:- start:1301 stop:1504 length:204 start_codon:yes stop_codon:yes gene_type:complete
MKQIVSITIGTTILLLAISSFEPLQSNQSDKSIIEVGEPSINTPDDIAQYIKEMTDDKTSIPPEQVL